MFDIFQKCEIFQSFASIGRVDLVKCESICAFNQEKALVGAFSVIVKSSGTFG